MERCRIFFSWVWAGWLLKTTAGLNHLLKTAFQLDLSVLLSSGDGCPLTCSGSCRGGDDDGLVLIPHPLDLAAFLQPADMLTPRNEWLCSAWAVTNCKQLCWSYRYSLVTNTLARAIGGHLLTWCKLEKLWELIAKRELSARMARKQYRRQAVSTDLILAGGNMGIQRQLEERRPEGYRKLCRNKSPVLRAWVCGCLGTCCPGVVACLGVFKYPLFLSDEWLRREGGLRSRSPPLRLGVQAKRILEPGVKWWER